MSSFTANGTKLGFIGLGSMGSRVLAREYGPQFPLPFGNKDFQLILQLAGEVDAAMPATSAALVSACRHP